MHVDISSTSTAWLLCLLWDLPDLAGVVYLHSNTTRTPHHVCFELTGVSWCSVPTQQHYLYLLLYLFLNYSSLYMLWALPELTGAVYPHSNTTHYSENSRPAWTVNDNQLVLCKSQSTMVRNQTLSLLELWPAMNYWHCALIHHTTVNSPQKRRATLRPTHSKWYCLNQTVTLPRLSPRDPHRWVLLDKGAMCTTQIHCHTSTKTNY